MKSYLSELFSLPVLLIAIPALIVGLQYFSVGVIGFGVLTGLFGLFGINLLGGAISMVLRIVAALVVLLVIAAVMKFLADRVIGGVTRRASYTPIVLMLGIGYLAFNFAVKGAFLAAGVGDAVVAESNFPVLDLVSIVLGVVIGTVSNLAIASAFKMK